MFHAIFRDPNYASIIIMIGVLLGFEGTMWMTAMTWKRLPKDGGREFAVDGKKSAGKPRGAGIIFIQVFFMSAILFAPMKDEYLWYLLLIVVCMVTGYLDDASRSPWNEYKKGLLDLLVAISVTVVYMVNHEPVIYMAMAIGNPSFKMPVSLFGILAVALIWTSVNVTNCADGVDGLSGTLCLITFAGMYMVIQLIGVGKDFGPQILIMGGCVLAYLWYNAAPSFLMMGDAGSRALGLFIAIIMLESGVPFLYPLVAGVLLLDGGLGLIKVALLRFLKIHIFKNVQMPLHDHVRKKLGWSNTQVVFRFAIFQTIIMAVVIAVVKMGA